MPAALTPFTESSAESSVEPSADPSGELDRQAASWASHGFPVPTETLARLHAALPDEASAGPDTERIGFVLVVPAAVTPAAEAMARTRLGTRTGSVNQHAADIDEYATIDAIEVPAGAAYLLVDVERGSEFCGMPPESALGTVAERGRTPLTVAEGIALLTVRPDVLETNHCFSLAGSRRGDRRVPAVWISKRAPHLGWCFAGAPHGWLGLASAGSRLG